MKKLIGYLMKYCIRLYYSTIINYYKLESKTDVLLQRIKRIKRKISSNICFKKNKIYRRYLDLKVAYILIKVKIKNRKKEGIKDLNKFIKYYIFNK